MIRHGETDLNVKGLLQGWVDEPLNQSGRRLAVLTGRAMKGIHFDDAISSPLKRAKETAEIVLRESGNRIPVTTDDRIKEINCGTLEGKPISVMGEAWQGRVPYNCCVSIVEAKKGKARLIEADKIYYDERMVVDRYRI